MQFDYSRLTQMCKDVPGLEASLNSPATMAMSMEILAPILEKNLKATKKEDKDPDSFHAQRLDEGNRRDTRREGPSQMRVRLREKLDKEKTELSEALLLTVRQQLSKIRACMRILNAQKGSINALAKSDPQMAAEWNPLAKHKQQERLANVAFNELMLEEGSPPIVGASKKKSKKPQKPTSQSTEETTEELPAVPPTTTLKAKVVKVIPEKKLLRYVMQFNQSYCPKYTEAERVSRWKKATLETIPGFVDYINNTPVYPYAGKDDAELKFQKDTHDVAWAKKIISGPLAEMYSVDHCYSKKRRGKPPVMQEGKALYASMHCGEEALTGLIVLGINSKKVTSEDTKKKPVIYHAQFRPFHQEDIMPSYVAELLKIAPLSDVEAEAKSSEEAPWEHTTSIVFSLIERNIIQIDITSTDGTEASAEGIFFRIYPLHDEAL